jgi:DNA polymerase-1
VRTLLVDADIVAFTTAARNETRIQWDADTLTSQVNETEAINDARQYLHGLKEDLHADRLIVCLSCPSRVYFRTDFYPEYKAHRTSGYKPMALDAVKKFLRESDEFESKWKPSLEADDCLGILATHPDLIPGEKVVVTCDKDLKQIAGLHFNPRKPDEGVYEIKPARADDFFYTQALTGDPTDGFPGCPRIGPVKAAKILAAARTDWALKVLPSYFTEEDYVWRAIVAAYEKAGKDVDYALTMARVARILRHTDYDFDNKKPILWSPTSATAYAPR